ncbi:MAG: hypothetical protein V8T86_17955 [Victivallis sp.]
MFKAEGTYDVVITRAILGESKFCKDAGAFDVCIEVQDANGVSDWWRGEYSNRPGVGNAAGKVQWEMTMATLTKIGLPSDNLFEHLQADADGTATIPALVGIQTTATVKTTERDGKIYHNVQYLGDGGGPKGMNLGNLLAMYGMTAQPVQQQPIQQPAAQPAAMPQPAAQPVQQPAQPAAMPGNIPAFPGKAAPNGPFANLKR